MKVNETIENSGRKNIRRWDTYPGERENGGETVNDIQRKSFGK